MKWVLFLIGYLVCMFPVWAMCSVAKRSDRQLDAMSGKGVDRHE